MKAPTVTRKELQELYGRLSPAARARFDADNASSFRLALPAFEPLRTPTHAPYRNKWERQYAALLDLQLASGMIAEWLYESDVLVAAGGTKYKPDFRVTYTTGLVEYHEVKGYTRSRDAVRMRECAAVSPHPIVVLTLKHGAWTAVRRYPAGKAEQP
jgi:hypothetical protein